MQCPGAKTNDLLHVGDVHGGTGLPQRADHVGDLLPGVRQEPVEQIRMTLSQKKLEPHFFKINLVKYLTV